MDFRLSSPVVRANRLAAANAMAVSPELLQRLRDAGVLSPGPAPVPAPGPVMPPTPPPVVAPEPPLAVPAAPSDNPFQALPFPSPGDRIKSDDFKNLSQSLRLIADSYALSASLFGRTFGEARQALASQGYQIQRVMSVFGTLVDNPTDSSLDGRRVVHAAPVALGERSLMVVVTEAVDTRRFAPNLIGKTYKEALEIMKTTLGDATLSGLPMQSPQLTNRTLGQAALDIQSRT